MDDAVSDALHARGAEPEGLKKMLLVSVAAHVVLMAFAALAPASFWLRPIDATRSVVTIDLGPAQGEESGGFTSIGDRPVQRAVPDRPVVPPTHPPAAKTPDPALQEAQPRVTPTVDDAPPDMRARTNERTQTVGREVVAGSTPAPTGTQSTSVGLSTSNGSVGAGAQLNVGDFCCPDYVGTMIRRIHQHWNAGSGTGAVTTMTFTVQRDGAIAEIRLARSSGNQMLDFLAERALPAVRQLPPLPDAYPHQSLSVSLEFRYQR